MVIPDHIGIPVSILTAVKDDEGKDTEEKRREQINKAMLLTRNKSDIEKEEYQQFYKHRVSHDFQVDPLTWSHNKVEVRTITLACFTSCESTLGHDEPYHKSGLKLYVTCSLLRMTQSSSCHLRVCSWFD
ncbi:hypothetical protein O9929_09435 [Vibrio lentus]|nr:hypothetical protein [Vibrio lentus]